MTNTNFIRAPSDVIRAPIIIAVMGLTGSGKSTFIQKASGLPDIEIGHNLNSCTQEPQMHQFTHGPNELILIDTPGFDDTFRDDAQVLQEVANYLALIYRQQMKLSGIVYLHDITKNRMSHGGTANLAMFQALCGDEPLKHVILATTRWGVLGQDSLKHADEFEHELKTNQEYWGDMIAKGSEVLRFENTKESAFEILDPLIRGRKEVTLQIQQEMVNEGRSVASTSAGEQLNQKLIELEERLRQQMVTHERAIEDARQQHNVEMEAFKTTQADKTRKLLRQIQSEKEKLQEDRRDETRQLDMKLNQLRKKYLENEKKAVGQLQNEIVELKTTLTTAQGEREKYEEQVNMKEASKSKREKWLAIIEAGATTAAAAGLSVINPLAIPVAVGGGIRLINEFFTKAKTNKQDGKNLLTVSEMGPTSY